MKIKYRLILTTALWAAFFVFPSILVVIRAHVLELPASASRSFFWIAAESGLILLALLLIARDDYLWNTLTANSRSRKLLIVGMVAFVLAAQGFSGNRVLYPAIGWSMYTNPTPKATAYRFIVEHESGRREDFPFELFHPQTHGLTTRFERTIDRVLASDLNVVEKNKALDDLTADLQELANLYRRHLPAVSLSAIDVIEYSASVQDYTGPQSVTKQLVLRLELE